METSKCRLKEQGFSAGKCAVEVDSEIPFTILAFFPAYKTKDHAGPSVVEIVDAYQRIKAVGLKNIRLGNVGGFARSEADQNYLMVNVDSGAY